jgi:hypothetical protein
MRRTIGLQGYPYYKYYVDNTRHQTTIYILQVYIL